MRILIYLGVLLTLAGGYILVQGFSITRERDVLRAGPLEARIETRERVPPWVGGVGVALGLVMIIAGAGAGSNKRL
jgi:hypothetical protein